MAKTRSFQIRSKEDARYLAEEIKYHGTSFLYYLPLMGINGGMMTIRCNSDRKKCTISASASGWQNREETSMHDIVEYIWKDRKLINQELRYSESA